MNLVSLAGVRVLVVGDVILDATVRGDVTRISPEAPVPVMEVRERAFHAGGAANVAANVKSLGGEPMLVGVIGVDDDGKRLSALVDCGRVLVADPGRPTTLKTRFVARGQHLLRIDQESRMDIGGETLREVLAAARAALGSARVLVLSDYAKGALPTIALTELIGEARRRGIPCIVDPKHDDTSRYAGATLLTPNQEEAIRAAGASDVRSAGEQLLGLHEAVLITEGAAGMTLFRRSAPPHHQDAVSRPVADRTGAGDTVVAALAVALGAGLSIEDAIRLSSHAAGVVVSKPGTAVCTIDELRGSLAQLLG